MKGVAHAACAWLIVQLALLQLGVILHLQGRSEGRGRVEGAVMLGAACCRRQAGWAGEHAGQASGWARLRCRLTVYSRASSLPTLPVRNTA